MSNLLFHNFEPTRNDNDLMVSFALPDGRNVTTPSHNLQVKNENKRITYVNADSALPSGLYKGSEGYVDFTLNGSDFHLIEKLQIKFKFDVSGETGDTVVLPPTPYWINRIELSVGNDEKLETIYHDDIFSERLGFFVSENQSEKEKRDFNTNSTYGNGPALAIFNNYVRYVPIVSFLDSTQKYFYQGMVRNGRMRIRIYFPTSLKVSGDADVTVHNVQMVVHDLRLSARRLDYYNALYSSSVSYRVISRVTYEKPLTITSGQTYDIQLTPFHGPTCALKVFITPQQRNQTNFLVKNAPLSLQILNENGSRITEILPEEYIRTFINPEHSHKDSLYDTQTYEYILPFGSNLKESVESGAMTGLRMINGKEMLRIDAGTLNGNYQVIIKQYKYHEFQIINNVPTLKH